MKLKKWVFFTIALIAMLSLTVGAALADDSIMFRRNISKTPEGETEDAGIAFMPFTVPPQAADGTLLEGVDYVTEDETLAFTTTSAKPLIAVYVDDVAHELSLDSIISRLSGISFGQREAFVAHSLDDGASWKTVNVSRAADLSSFTLQNGHDYPGDTFAAVQAVAGNRVMAAWLSRYCDGGNP
ncbi:MAG TPA: hypothetical protein PJ988_21030, partial [Anaerolinea sp.]|nr:hypothetical protein [Anaerolinea sp.]